MSNLHSRKRSYKHSGKGGRKTRLWVVFNLIVLDLLLLAAIFMIGKNLPGFNSQVSEPRIEQSQENKSDTSKQDNDSSKTDSKEKIEWVKQDEPVQIPILMYHAIHVMDPSEAANAGLIVDPEVFESHLKALKEAGYYSLTPEEAYKVLTENVLPKNKKVVWLTFDDSMEDFYTNAFPLLQKYQTKATNNVITGFVEENRPSVLTLEQMKEMKNKGMSFEDHTVNHPDLSASAPDVQQNELSSSKEYLDQALHQRTTTVAYPSGRYSDTTLQIAESLGYKMGLTTNNGLASLADGLLSLNRVRVNPTTTAEDLLSEITIKQ